MTSTAGACAKRLMDICGATFGLIVSSPVLAVSALAIVLTDGAPVMFRQERVGRNDRRFEILKFRTMRAGASGLQISSDKDPRITPVGAFLRRTKIDELPQLFNALRGEMSLVGPRPEVARYTEQWPSQLRPIILSVRPGITDPASILFRHESELLASSADPEARYVQTILPEKAAMYADYVRTRSLGGDLRIIVQTILRVVRA